MSTKFLYGQLLSLITTTKIAHRTSSFLHPQTDLLGKERRFFSVAISVNQQFTKDLSLTTTTTI